MLPVFGLERLWVLVRDDPMLRAQALGTTDTLVSVHLDQIVRVHNLILIVHIVGLLLLGQRPLRKIG
jgi:hypothetical protein